MTAQADMAVPRTRALPLAALAALVALLVLALMQGAAAWKAGGIFEYPLDDPYIHLAVAEQMVHGGYGVNLDEWISAASSPVWPLLLLPGATEAWGRYLPLFWNALALAAAAWLFARILIEAGAQARWPRATLALALLGPVALNLPGLAFTGMEHTAHAAASLAIVLGLVRLTRDAPGWGLPLVLGVLLAPALRLEGLALGLLAALAVGFAGHRLAMIGLGLLAVLPVAGFIGFLTVHGIGPLPSSVLAKMLDGGVAEMSQAARLFIGFRANLDSLPGMALFGLFVLSLVAWGLLRGTPAARLVAVGAFTALAHLLLGQIGWLNRYEVYAMVSTFALLVAALAMAPPQAARAPMLAGAAGVIAAICGAYYAQDFARVGYWSPRGIDRQQAQMARFVRDFAQTPAAVNDLGRVAWRNPYYVLDLWGLGNAEARVTRIVHPAPGWAGDLVARAGVPLVMIYADAFEDGLGPEWTFLGELQLRYPRGFIGSGFVQFFAATPGDVPKLTQALRDFAPTLPEGVRFLPASGVAS